MENGHFGRNGPSVANPVEEASEPGLENVITRFLSLVVMHVRNITQPMWNHVIKMNAQVCLKHSY